MWIWQQKDLWLTNVTQKNTCKCYYHCVILLQHLCVFACTVLLMGTLIHHCHYSTGSSLFIMLQFNWTTQPCSHWPQADLNDTCRRSVCVCVCVCVWLSACLCFDTRVKVCFVYHGVSVLGNVCEKEREGKQREAVWLCLCVLYACVKCV